MEHVQSSQRAESGQGQGGENGQRVNEVLVQDCENHIDHENGGTEQQGQGLERALKGLGRAGELAADVLRQSLIGGLSDGAGDFIE